MVVNTTTIRLRPRRLLVYF